MAWGSFEQIRRGESISHDFSEPGVYSYVCNMHPGMVGTVVVGDDVAMSPASAVTPKGDATWVVVAAILAAAGGLTMGRRIGKRVTD
jgi:hypothetical protein